MTGVLPFEADESAHVARHGPAFTVDVDGFEGPLDLLLALARDQKVDLIRISVVRLADQYLDFVQKVRATDLELAADYLVMAAWLAFLKSRLLLPAREIAEEDPPTPQEMAETLALRLRRLEAVQRMGAVLMAQPGRLGQGVFGRGAHAEEAPTPVRSVHDVTLHDLLTAYAEHLIRTSVKTLHIEAADLWSVDDALKRMERLLGQLPDWSVLSAFLPPVDGDDLRARSANAATFVAALELARQGKVVLRQDGGAFSAIQLKAVPNDR